MFTPIKNRKIYQQVAEQIQNMVLDGTLKCGDKLPTERALAENFQVSRASVREAMRALEIVGIIECRQGGGNFIRTTFDHHVFEPLSVMFKLHNGTFRDILEFRMIFEPEAARLAAERLQESDEKVLKQLMTRLKNSKNETTSVRIDQQIHAKLAEVSGNYLIQSMMDANSVIMQSFIKEARDFLSKWRDSQKQLTELHLQICQAVIDRNPTKAVELSRKHFKLIIDNIEM